MGSTRWSWWLIVTVLPACGGGGPTDAAVTDLGHDGGSLPDLSTPVDMTVPDLADMGGGWFDQCQVDADCHFAGATCSQRFPGGLCTKAPCASDADCGGGGTCVSHVVCMPP